MKKILYTFLALGLIAFGVSLGLSTKTTHADLAIPAGYVYYMGTGNDLTSTTTAPGGGGGVSTSTANTWSALQTFSNNNITATETIANFLGVGGQFYSQRAQNNVTNSTTANLSLVNTTTYYGTTTIPANFLLAGDTVQFNIGGKFTANGGNYTWKVWLNNATTTCATAAYTPTAHATAFQWNMQGQITIYTTGSGGTWGSQCALATNSAAVTNQYVDMGNTTGAINTTVPNTLSIVLTMATASTTNSVTTTVAEFNILRAQ